MATNDPFAGVAEPSAPEVDPFEGVAGPINNPEERDTFTRVTDFLTGNTPKDEDLPALGSISQGLTTGQKLRLAGGMLATGNEEAIGDIVKTAVPGAKVEKDRFGNVIVQFGDDTPELKGQRVFVNPPGLDMQDIMSTIGDIAKFIPAGRIAGRAATTTGRVTRAGVGETATEGISQVGAQALGSKQGFDPIALAFAGVGGAGGEAISAAVVPFVRTALRTRRLFNPSTGQLTRAGRDAARTAGLDPEDIDPGLGRLFARELARGKITGSRINQILQAAGRRGVPADEAGANAALGTALSQRFEVPLTKGQRSLDPRQLSTESGLKPELLDANRAQSEAVQQSLTDVQSQISGGGRQFATVPQAGGAVKEGIEEGVDALNRQIDAAFDTARGIQADFTGDRISELSKRVSQVARDFPIDAGTLPRRSKGPATDVGTKQALKSLKDIAGLGRRVRRASRPGSNQQVGFRQFELLRRRLVNNIKNANGPDKVLTIRIKDQLDGFLDDAMTNKLFDGDPTVLARNEEARALRTQMRLRFGKRNANDQAGAIVQKIQDLDMTPEQTTRAIFGTSAIGRKDVSAKVVERLAETFGRESDEFRAVQQAAFLRVTEPGRTFSAKNAADSIRDFFKESPTLANNLFDSQDQQILRQYRVLMERIASSRNTARFGGGLQQVVQRSMRGVFGTLQTGQRMRGQAEKAWFLQILKDIATPAGRSQGRSAAAARDALREFATPNAPSITAIGAAIGSSVDQPTIQADPVGLPVGQGL